MTREERLAKDCREAKELLGTTAATWITFSVIKDTHKKEGDRDESR